MLTRLVSIDLSIVYTRVHYTVHWWKEVSEESFAGIALSTILTPHSSRRIVNGKNYFHLPSYVRIIIRNVIIIRCTCNYYFNYCKS